MTEPGRNAGPAEPRPPGFDEDLDVRSVLTFGLGLALVMAVVLAALWGLLARWKSAETARDARPSPVYGESAGRLPPEPRLQSAPVEDMTALRARETAILTSYGWIDRDEGVARIPIDRAIDLMLEKGLPAPRPESTPAPRSGRPRRTGPRRTPAANAPRPGSVR